MKKLLLTLAFFTLSLSVGYAQNVKLEIDELLRLYSQYSKAIINPKKNMDPGVWFKRAEIFYNIATVTAKYISIGNVMTLDQLNTILGEIPKSKPDSPVGTDAYQYERIKIYLVNGKVDSWEDTYGNIPDPIKGALEALSKCDSLDLSKKFTKANELCRANIVKIYRDKAELSLKKKDQKGAYGFYKNLIAISENNLGIRPTKDYYTAGMIALDLKIIDEAIKYLQKAADQKYKDPNLYNTLNPLYYKLQSKEDTIKALNVIQQGLEVYPNDIDLLQSIIYHYVNNKEKAKAVEYIGSYKNINPNNSIMYYLEGTYYAQINEMDKAIDCYVKSIEINPNYFNPNYRLGEYYLSQAEDIYKIADKERDPKKFEEKIKPAIELYKKALVYYERAYALKSNESIARNIKIINIRLEMIYKVVKIK